MTLYELQEKVKDLIVDTEDYSEELNEIADVVYELIQKSEARLTGLKKEKETGELSYENKIFTTGKIDGLLNVLGKKR